jgi:ribonuclease HI
VFIEKETESRYFAFNPALSGPFTVYVDGSFNADYDTARDTMTLAAGWAIVNEQEELFGYGGMHATVPVTWMTALCELRAIVSFLDAFREEFPGRVTKDFPVTIISDNQHLVNNLNESRDSQKVDAYCREKYGQDYTRLLDYLFVMDVSFDWVKGHHENNFNVLADRIALKAYKRVLATGSYPSSERKTDCAYLLELFHQKQGVFSANKNPLTHQKLRNLVKKSGAEVLTSLPTLWVGTKMVQHEGRTFSGFAFTDSTSEIQGYRAGIHVKDPDELYVNLRALNYALGKYGKSQELPESLVIRTDSEELSALVNNPKHRKWKSFKGVPAFHQEFQKLVAFKEDCSVVALEVSDGRRTYMKFPAMAKSSAFVEETSAKVIQSALRAF